MDQNTVNTIMLSILLFLIPGAILAAILWWRSRHRASSAQSGGKCAFSILFIVVIDKLIDWF